MITVSSANDIRVGYFDRYFIARDIDGVYRVISVQKNVELSPYIDANREKRYKFATRPGGYATLWGQTDLEREFNHCWRTPRSAELCKLINNKIVRILNEIRDTSTPVSTVGSPFQGGWVIASILKGSGALGFSSTPKVHESAESAEAEANRLANAYPGKEFVVFRATMSAVKSTVVTRTF